MRHGTGSLDPRVRREQADAPPAVTEQELPVDEIVAQNLVVREQPIEHARMRLSRAEEADPDGRVDQDHYATRCLRVGFSRRRGATCAPGSDPRNAQHRLAWAGLPGVTFVGAIPRKELCRHQQEAELMLYPSTYEELFCVSVAECSYAGAIPITSEKAALATTNEFGFKIPGQPGTLDFTNAFASMAIRLLETDRQYTATRRPTMMANAARRFSWERIAKQWEYVLEKGEAPPEGLQ